MKILLVEDDTKIASFVIQGFKESGFVVDHAVDGEDGKHMAIQASYDAAIIDLMLPKLDGLSLIQELRARKVNIPIIILSAKSSVDDRIKGLEMGADDYLTKPFSFSELLMRVRALLRRSNSETVATKLEVGNIKMDVLNREVIREDKYIHLQPREFCLLEYLMRNHDRVLTKTLIMEHVYGYYFDPQSNVVDVLVCRLRNKLEKGFGSKVLHTIRGVGYVLKES